MTALTLLCFIVLHQAPDGAPIEVEVHHIAAVRVDPAFTSPGQRARVFLDGTSFLVNENADQIVKMAQGCDSR